MRDTQHTSGAIDVVCAVIESDGRILAARRSPGRPHAGLWEFPGGKVRDGETPAQALVREIREELGIDIVIIKPLRPNTHRYPGKTIRLIPFVCTPAGAHPLVLKDHDAVEWLMPEHAAGRPWAAADVAVFEQYVRGREC